MRKYGFVDPKKSPHIYYAPLQGPNILENITGIPPEKMYISLGDFDVV